MLLDLTAVLLTSATQFSVAEAFAAPVAAAVAPAVPGLVPAPFAAPVAAAVAPAVPGLVPAPFIGPEPAAGGVPVDQIAGLRGTALLTQLELLSASDLRALLDAHPDLVSDALASPPSASETTALWGRASASTRERLTVEAPQLVGNLEGVPYAARDAANRLLLHDVTAEIEDRLATGVGRAEEAELRTRLHMLGEVAAALAPGESGLPRRLVALDPAGDGRAAIAIGDLATADYVTYLVPGMYFRVDGQMIDWTDTADALAAEQQDWLARFGESDRGVATISWLGYRTPALTEIASMDLAREGGVALTGSLDGLASTRGRGDEPYVTVVGHSYGSTAAMLALQGAGVSVDALAMVGSPGAPARTASELDVPGGNVWVGVAPWDPVPETGVFGSQPASAAFGAHLFGVSGDVDPITGRALGGTVSHNDYFTPGGESLRNLALIGIDRGADVLPPR